MNTLSEEGLNTYVGAGLASAAAFMCAALAYPHMTESYAQIATSAAGLSLILCALVVSADLFFAAAKSRPAERTWVSSWWSIALICVSGWIVFASWQSARAAEPSAGSSSTDDLVAYLADHRREYSQVVIGPGALPLFMGSDPEGTVIRKPGSFSVLGIDKSIKKSIFSTISGDEFERVQSEIAGGRGNGCAQMWLDDRRAEVCGTSPDTVSIRLTLS